MSDASTDFVNALQREFGSAVMPWLEYHHGQDAGDVFNRVLLAAWRSGLTLASFESERHRARWFFSLLRHSRRWVRQMESRSRFWRREVVFSDFGDGGTPGAVVFLAFIAAASSHAEAEPLAWQDQRLLSCWQACSPKRRRAVELVVLNGLGFAEAAGLVGSSREVIWKQVKDGLRELRQRYEAAA